MAAFDWDAIDNEFPGGDFLPYAEPGTYNVLCDDVEFKAAGTKGNYVMKFHFADKNGVKFPTADHWLTKDKQNWRMKHCKDLYMVLGASEENAKKACELAESKDSFDYAVSAYQQGFASLLGKGNSMVEIEVTPDGKYSRAEFTDRRVAMRNDKKEDVIASGEEVILDTDLPF